MSEFVEKYIPPFTDHADEDSLKYYRDLKNSLDTAREEGKIEGKIEIAINALKKGLHVKDIIELTGLTEDEIIKIKAKI